MLRAYDRTLFGGGYEDLPDLYVERSPMTYIENVRAPVLILAGDNDTRCPIRQILNYCDRLTELGREFELYRFEAGHGSMVMDEQIRQMRLRLDYALARIDAGAAVARRTRMIGALLALLAADRQSVIILAFWTLVGAGVVVSVGAWILLRRESRARPPSEGRPGG